MSPGEQGKKIFKKSDEKATINHLARWIKPTCRHVFGKLACQFHHLSQAVSFIPRKISPRKNSSAVPYFPIKSNKYCAFRCLSIFFSIVGFSGKYPVSGLELLSYRSSHARSHAHNLYSNLKFPLLLIYAKLCNRREMRSFSKFRANKLTDLSRKPFRNELLRARRQKTSKAPIRIVCDFHPLDAAS